MKPKNSLFYISSRGVTATVWLSKVLSRHPQIVCFRATRSFPPYTANDIYPESSVDAFMEGLLECRSATLDEKIFGSIHGYHGITAKEPCEKRGGIFSYVIRHPISRVHSIYTLYLERKYYNRFKIPIANRDIHDRVCSKLLANMDLMDYTKILKPDTGQNSLLGTFKGLSKKVLPDFIIKYLMKQRSRFSRKRQYISVLRTGETIEAPDESSFAGIQFVLLVNEIMKLDQELFDGCPVNLGIKMEEMVKSPEYFKNHLWPLVAPGLEITDAYLESIIREPRINVHRDKTLSPGEIWKSWPTGMKEIFLKYFEQYNISAVCKAFDYDVSFL